jgi:polar amino acid transport system permease protein
MDSLARLADLFSLLSLGPEGWGDEFLRGAGLTLLLALCTLPVGLAIGFAVALAKDSRSLVLRGVGNVYTTVFRALPELLTILIIYYGGQIMIREVAGALGFPAFEVNGFVAGLVSLGLVLGAFSSEVLLGALRAVPKGQREGSYALGLGRYRTFRHVIVPQLLRIALPGLGNNWLALLKETSLVSVIAFSELMRVTNIAVGVTKQPFFFYLVCCLLYLAMAVASSFVLDWLEARSRRGLNRAGA